MDTWEMHAHRHDDGRFHTVGSLRYVRDHQFKEPIHKVLVEEVAEDDDTATHWGWMRVAYMYYEADTEPGMIRGTRGQFEMCFPYGSKAVTEHGRVLRLRVTQIGELAMEMISASISHNGTRHEGTTPESIARRVWGRKAEVRYSTDPNSQRGDAAEATITRADRHGTHVLARVVVREETTDLTTERVTENYRPRPGEMATRTFWIAYPDHVSGYARMGDRIQRAAGAGKTRREALDNAAKAGAS